MIDLTTQQKQALRLAKFAGAPITLADFPTHVTAATVKILSERGLLAATVTITPAGERLLREYEARDKRRKAQEQMNDHAFARKQKHLMAAE